MARILLILPTATYRAADFMTAARKLGVEVAIASEHRQAMSGDMGDRALVLPLSQPQLAADAIGALHERTPLDAVVAVDDSGTAVAALASERLGLGPSNPPDAAAAARDKSKMRDAFAVAGLPQPDYRLAWPGDDVGRLAEEVGLPCVVKPLSLSASRGVIRADSPSEADTAAERVRSILRCAREDDGAALLVESYVPGAEVAVEGLLRGGELEVLAIFDKPDPLEGPYFEETIYVTPSRLPSQERIVSTAQAAARSLGLREGPVHAELRIADAGDPVVLELAARSIGGLCARSLRFGLGTSLEELIIEHALGRTTDGIRREKQASGVMMLPIPRAGTLREVRGTDSAREVPGIAGLEISVAPGRAVEPLPEGDRYLGFLFAKAQTPEQVEAALREAHSRLDVVID
ncbi:MAG: ATP-grasp domain-containing protein [Thermoleophilaceae bacterium]